MNRQPTREPKFFIPSEWGLAKPLAEGWSNRQNRSIMNSRPYD